jgi:hypothetical protein
MRWRLQPYAMEAATPCDGGCNPMRWRLQPHALAHHERLLGSGMIWPIFWSSRTASSNTRSSPAGLTSDMAFLSLLSPAVTAAASSL